MPYPPPGSEARTPPDRDCGPNDVVAKAAALLDLWLDTTTGIPDMHIHAAPELPVSWRVAHCCRRILIQPNQPYPALLAAIEDAVHALRARDHTRVGAASAAEHPPDELALMRRRKAT